MRRVAASVLVTLGLVSAGVAWWSFAARATVLDPARSERIADTLIDQPVIRDAVADGLGTALIRALPPGTPIDASEVESAARRALDDPRAQEALRTAVLRSHQRLLGTSGPQGGTGDGGDPVTLDASAIAAAGRDALLAIRPELAASLPAAPSLSIDLPTHHLPALGWLPGLARELTALALFLAVALLGGGMAAAADRPAVLARTGRWALRAGLLWAAFGWALPSAMTRIDDPRLAALGAIGVAAVGPMVAPAVLLVSTGVAAMVGARAWRRAPAALPPAPPSGRPFGGGGRPGTPIPTPAPAAPRPDPYGRSRQPAGTSGRTWRF